MKLRTLQIFAILEFGAAQGLLTRSPRNPEEYESLLRASALFAFVATALLVVDFLLTKWKAYKVSNKRSQ